MSSNDKIIFESQQQQPQLSFGRILFNHLGVVTSRLGGGNYSTASTSSPSSSTLRISERKKRDKTISRDEQEGRFISYYEQDINTDNNNNHSTCDYSRRSRQRAARPTRAPINNLRSSGSNSSSQLQQSQPKLITTMTAADYHGNFPQLEDDLIMSSNSANIQQQQQQIGSNGSLLSLGLGTSSTSAAAAVAADKSGHNCKNFGKLVGKKAARLKELVLQNLGKADRTQDELFDFYEENFHKQQAQVAKLTKEFKTYLNAMKHFQEASRGLNQCIQLSTSDYQPARHDLVCENLSQLETLNEDLMEKLQEQVVKQVGEYLAKFGEMRDKIAKRHRKLIDYDKSRRLYELTLAQLNKRRAKYQQQQVNGGGGGQNGEQQQQENYNSILRGLKFLSQQQQQQQNQQLNSSHRSTSLTGQQEFIASQLVDEARLLKFREQFNYCKLMYESINGELHEEMPIVYEKKMKSLLTALQSYFALEAHYHSNAGKLLGSVSDVIDEIPVMSIGKKLNGTADHEQDLNRRRTIINQNGQEVEEEGDDDDDDVDDDGDSYESSSNGLHNGGGLGGVGVGPGGHSSDTMALTHEHKSKAHMGGCSSSGLGSSSSGGDSSSSVSPDCEARRGDVIVMAPDGQQRAQEHRESGKVEEPADCSLGGGVISGVEMDAEVAEQQQQQQQQQVTVAIIRESSVTAAAAAVVAVAGVEESAGCALEVSEELVEDEEVAIVVGEDADDDKPITIVDDDDNKQDESQVSSNIDDHEDDELQNVSTDIIETSTTTMTTTSASISGDGSNVLYKVRTNYKYLAEDVDELCFEADEIIEVIEFDDNQEPEEGWLMGIRQINGQRGLFPANFTVPI